MDMDTITTGSGTCSCFHGSIGDKDFNIRVSSRCNRLCIGMENGRVCYDLIKDEFLPGDMGATKAKEEEVETPLGIRLDDDFGGDSYILVWMVRKDERSIEET